LVAVDIELSDDPPLISDQDDHLGSCLQGARQVVIVGQNSLSVADLQRFLGHESPQMSLYYAHVTNTGAVERQKSNSVTDSQLRRAD
jgi:hypothetical protein